TARWSGTRATTRPMRPSANSGSARTPTSLTGSNTRNCTSDPEVQRTKDDGRTKQQGRGGPRSLPAPFVPFASFRPSACLPRAFHMMELVNVTKVYQQGRRTVHAVRGVSMTVASGEFVSIMGPSGSGKSTLMHLLGGLDTPSSGRALFDGKDLAA